MIDEIQQSEEALLVLQAQQGDGAAFRTLVELYDRRLLYFIRRILDETEEAFDVLQEVPSRAHCPHCGQEHEWRKSDARLAETIPPAEWIENQIGQSA